MLIFGLFLLAGEASARPGPLPEEGTRIAEVRVEGLQRLSPNAILRVMELRQGRSFTEQTYREDLQAISNIGRIDPLQLRISWEEAPDEDGVILTVHVRENPMIREISIIGNVRFSRNQIKNQLDFAEGDIIPTGIRASTIRNLQNFYRDGGYRAARVGVEVQPVASNDNVADVVININEGQRIRIRRLHLPGNEQFSDFYIRMRVSNAPGLLFFNNYYDENAVEDDLSIIQALYQRAGYLDAQARRGTFDYDEENQTIELTYEIEAGPRYRVTSVRTEGVTYFHPEEVDRITRTLANRTFDGRRLVRALDRLRELYGNEGYIDTDLSYRLERNREAREVDIVIEVNESPPVYVGEIRLRKEEFDFDIELNLFDRFMDWFAPPTKDETIMREVRLEPGEKYRLSDEQRTVHRLRRLGIFRRVQVTREPTADPSVRDAVIEVDEDPAAAFVGASAGVGEVSGPTVTFELVQPNFGGEANRFRAAATFGTRNTAYRLGYFQRYLGDTQTSLDLNLFRTTDRFRVYRQRVYGSSAEFGRPISERERIYGYLRFRAEHVRFYRFDRDTDESFDNYPVLAVRPMVVRDHRDDTHLPTRGHAISGGIETGIADGFLLKFLHGYEWYTQPLEQSDLVYAYEHSVGLMPYDAREVGLSERFFVGGTGNLRGFRAREVGPRDSRNPDLAIGGSTRITQRHELRYPFTDFLTGRVFTDAAILERGFLELGTPRVGSGAGAIMDFGPFVAEIDLATALLKESADKRQFFHLRLRSRF